MCLILFAWQAHPEYSLIVAANRDEYHGRPAEAAAFWSDKPAILAGRDLEGLGTWLGISRDGKFSAITNYRDMDERRDAAPSRGLLASRFLENKQSAREYTAEVDGGGNAYRGFNLLAADGEEYWWTSNRGTGPRRLEPGVYGLANHLIETPWPKVSRGKERLLEAIGSAVTIDTLLGFLGDSEVASDEQLPDTGVGLERERMLSAARIVSPLYGTRCSTALIVERSGRVAFAERSYAADGSEGDTVRFEFEIET